MTRVVRYHQFGGPEVLQIDEVDVRGPGPGEVQINVRAIGINRAEAMLRMNFYTETPELPASMGYEASGVIEAVGAGVEDFALGDVVSVIPSLSMVSWPSYGEVANFPAQVVVKHPARLSWEEAAGAWMQYLTAYGALIDVAKVKAGDVVLITAASSSVGLAAIQIANLVGATPIAATRTSAKRQALLNAGARHVIATEEEDLVARLAEITGSAGPRVAFDPIGGPFIETLAQAVAPCGMIIEYGALSPDPTPLPLFPIMVKSLAIRGFIYSEIVKDPVRLAGARAFIYDGLDSGELKPIIDRTFAFDQIVEAHKYMESNQQFGKIIVTL